MDWLPALRRYLGASVFLHVMWETLQLPLYTLWTTGTFREQAFAVLHCTAGDIIIAGLSLLAALVLLARRSWPRASTARVYAASLTFGIIYTIYSEWLNTTVRASWAYSDLMPVVPVIGTGLAPLLQWILLPTLAQWIALRRAPWTDQVSDGGV